MAFAVGGQAALAEMAAAPFDVVVSDMRMPGMDGDQLLSIVREQYPCTRRLILSGYAAPDVTDRGKVLAHAYLAKPCDLHALAAAIEGRDGNASSKASNVAFGAGIPRAGGRPT